MKKIIFTLMILFTTVVYGQITGAGATFPYPLYSKWAQEYKNKTGIDINYQSIGSGGGIKQIIAKTVDFGATDAPLEMSQLEKEGLIQFPVVIGGVVPVFNLKDIKSGDIKLTNKILVDIFLGKIKKWNASEIAEINKGIKLPDLDITVVSRSDGSGTSFIFTSYLSKVNNEWKDKVGASTSVKWPTGVAGKGNEGVASYIQKLNGSIGYVEYAYALQNKMSYILLQNKDGYFVSPDDKTFSAAAANAQWDRAPGYYLLLIDQPGKDSWPITGATFILLNTKKQENTIEVLKFFSWAYQNGNKMALDLDYVPMPDKVKNKIISEWKKIGLQ
jgi:phosphate transport system substrate-binding protein